MFTGRVEPRRSGLDSLPESAHGSAACPPVPSGRPAPVLRLRGPPEVPKKRYTDGIGCKLFFAPVGSHPG